MHWISFTEHEKTFLHVTNIPHLTCIRLKLYKSNISTTTEVEYLKKTTVILMMIMMMVKINQQAWKRKTVFLSCCIEQQQVFMLTLNSGADSRF